MDFYSQSTHANGLLQRSQIIEVRQKILDGIMDSCPEGVSWLSYDECEAITFYYQTKIKDVCTFLKLPKSVQPVAHWIHRRYYLKESLLKFDAKHVMLACVLLATKLENLHLALSDFTGKIKNSNPDMIMEIEFSLLSALNFNLHFFHPHSCLTGFYLDIQAAGLKPDQNLMSKAGKVLDILVTTDAILIEPPSQLALAALFSESPDLVESYLEARSSQITDAKELLERLRLIVTDFLHNKPEPPSAAQLKEIDKKLMQARSALTEVDIHAS